jgi:hypothetical protein
VSRSSAKTKARRKAVILAPGCFEGHDNVTETMVAIPGGTFGDAPVRAGVARRLFGELREALPRGA